MSHSYARVTFFLFFFGDMNTRVCGRRKNNTVMWCCAAKNEIRRARVARARARVDCAATDAVYFYAPTGDELLMVKRLCMPPSKQQKNTHTHTHLVSLYIYGAHFGKKITTA